MEWYFGTTRLGKSEGFAEPANCIGINRRNDADLGVLRHGKIVDHEIHSLTPEKETLIAETTRNHAIILYLATDLVGPIDGI